MEEHEEVEKHKDQKKIGFMTVDDDPVFQKLISYNIKKLYPYSEVHSFIDSVAALDFYRVHYSTIDIVIIDMLMPKMNGLELSQEIENINKDERIMLISAYSLEEMISKKASGVIEFFLAKNQMDPTMKSFPTMLNYYTQKILSIKIKQKKRKQADEEIRMLNESLEQRIAERTATLERQAKEIKTFNETLEQRIAERTAELKMANKELLKMQKLESIGILAGGIAHDFNNYLQGILSNINMALKKVDPHNEIYGFLSEAIEAISKARGLTQQLLTFAKGGVPLKKSISVSKLLMDSTNLALSGSNVRSKFDIPSDIWQVEADKEQLSQVFCNLFINANHAMPESGTINVKAENINIVAGSPLPLNEGRYVNIIVADQGIGIQKENLQKIFDPYFTTKPKGSGLGLAITYSIVKKHNGYITVESEMGAGTTFNIYLLASEGEVSGETRMSEAKSSKETISLAGKKILFMDDDYIISKCVTGELKNLEYKVEIARNGTEAIELYEEAKKSGNPFDAVILDLTIPGGMGGEATMRKLLRIDPNVKAIVASGYSNDPVMSNFKKYGFKDAVSKPYESHELDEALHNMIMGKR